MESYADTSVQVTWGKNTSSEPSDAIHTVDQNGGDINAGQGGDYVWLSPKWQSNESNAVSNVRIIIQANADSSYKDLAHGAGGDYRYLRLERDGDKKITEIRLLRRKDSVDFGTVQSLGFDAYSTDINKGRGGDFLYLVWKLS
ncbi:hypothetical protein BO70DRAFT_399068 [Aspergillus heteromorphus CBS 117.55]|uniref:Uncharacterized protein n=1 Tax=Aspergillus heteromorphus CBS 117.55 TaxID=1448321 RepID=A0A317VF48_9EURO|nr:uncharacterized protein BO70DRAFT_399068 [Aspergillus heteromorphus CBS 117.55]PWY72994.1 hypothetical protein BO70DRAFT_399068 [Aspergillus heteromorphus CBS 117.55]